MNTHCFSLLLFYPSCRLYPAFGIHHYQVLLIHPVSCIRNTPLSSASYPSCILYLEYTISSALYPSCIAYLEYTISSALYPSCILYSEYTIHQVLSIHPVLCICNTPLSSASYLSIIVYLEYIKSFASGTCIRPVFRINHLSNDLYPPCIRNTPLIKCFVSILYSVFGIHHLSSALYPSCFL